MRAVLCIMLIALSGCSYARFPRITPQSIRVELRPAGVTAGLRGVAVVSDSSVWASGANGTVLRTIDAGQTWQRVPVPGAESLDFRCLWAFDDRTVCLLNAGAPACIYRTDDAGATWAGCYRNDDPGVFFDGLAFFDDGRGLALGDPIDGRFLLIETSDAGRTWRELPPAARPAASVGEWAFAASNSCLQVSEPNAAWIATGGAVTRVLRSNDAGRSWCASIVPIAAGPASAGTFSLARLDERRGVAVGGDYQRPRDGSGTAAVTSDGGRTWRMPRVGGPRGYRSCVVHIPNSDAVIAVGPGGVDFSADSGDSWQPIAGTPLNAISFARSGRVGWAVGPDGAVARITVERSVRGNE